MRFQCKVESEESTPLTRQTSPVMVQMAMSPFAKKS